MQACRHKQNEIQFAQGIGRDSGQYEINLCFNTRVLAATNVQQTRADDGSDD